MPIFQFRRGTPSQASASARVLSAGEPGVDRSAAGAPARMKIGDGVTPWDALPWLADGVSIRTIPGVAAGNTDNQPAIQAAIDAAPVGAVLVMPPGGPYLIRDTIRLGDRKRLQGGNQAFGTNIQAGLDGLAVMLTVDSGSVVEDLTLNGAGKASWGLKSGPQANKIHLQRVRVEQCTDAGFVYEGTQNSLSLDCFAQGNRINYLLVNGTVNCKWVNSNGSLYDSVGPTGRGILITNMTDPRLTGIIYANGTRSNSFYGGLHERGGDDHPMIEITHTTGYTALTELEITSAAPAAIVLGANVNGRLHLSRVAIALSSTNVAVSAASGGIHADHVTYTGTAGRPEDLLYDITGTASFTTAIDSASVLPNILGMRNSFFRYGIGAWVATGGGSVVWDASGWRMSVTSSGAGSGARCSFGAQTIIAAGRLARITFYVQAITGTAEMTVRATTNTGQKALNAAGNYGVGEHVITTVLDGDETGILISAASAGASTISVVYVMVSIL